MVKNSPANAGDVKDRFNPCREDALGKEMAIYTSILAWRISWIEEPGGLWSTASERVRHN